MPDEQPPEAKEPDDTTARGRLSPAGDRGPAPPGLLRSLTGSGSSRRIGGVGGGSDPGRRTGGGMGAGRQRDRDRPKYLDSLEPGDAVDAVSADEARQLPPEDFDG
jgi:hypothetical protein